MQSIWAAPAVLAMGVVIAASAFGQEIHLKTRTFTPTVQTEGSRRPTGIVSTRNTGSVHQIVTFDHTPGVTDLDALMVAGAQVTGVLSDNALLVSSPAGLRARAAGAVWIGAMEAQDKISPLLASTMNGVAGSQASAIVEFHSDVDFTHQTALETALNLVFVRPAGMLAQHAIVQATASNIKRLASEDEVAYIFPADPALLTGAYTYPCAGMLTTAGAVAQYANITHGWNLDADNAAHLTYFFASLTNKAPGATVRSEILRAFAQWAKIVNVTFQPAALAGMARSISIEFASGAHDDSYPFDGPGGQLAHTFYPVPINSEPIAGDMHFDGDEQWKVGSDTDVYTVALHEIGHALGLTHSDNPGDVMYPYYHRGMVLSANDVGAALELYPAAGSVAGTGAVPITVSAGPIAPPTTVTGTTSATPATALVLTIGQVPASTQSAVIALGGTVSGGNGGDSVQWQTNHGYSGAASLATSGIWSAGNVPLVTGANIVTVTAFNAADQVATSSASVTLSAANTIGAAPLTVAIHSPVSAVVTVKASTLSVSGTASGGAGVTQIVWQTSNGASGTACGTSTWVASGIPLPEGNTTIIVRAYDAKGANSWVALVAVRP